MDGPGEYLPDVTEGITRVEDLPQARVVGRSRNYRRRPCPECGHSAYRDRVVARTLHELGDLKADRAGGKSIMAGRTLLSQKTTDDLLKTVLVFSRMADHLFGERAVESVDDSLSRSKAQVLRLLGQRGGQTSTQIARFLGISKPAVTQIVDGMVQNGKLVTRTKSRRDRRSAELKLTPKGKRVFRQVREEQRHLLRSAIMQSSRGDAERWIRSLQHLTQALARADQSFEEFCLQCGAHADGTCILVGDDADCLFLRHQGKRAPSRTRRAKPPCRAKR